MNLQIISTDDVLVQSFKKSKLFEKVSVKYTFEEFSPLEKGVLFLTDSVIDYTQLTDLDIEEDVTVFYLIGKSHEFNIERSVKAICDSRDFHFVAPGLTVNQVVERVESVLNPTNEHTSNVITFFSAISNVGTTSTCLSVAQAISNNSKAKVGVLNLNAWDDGTDQLPTYKGSYLNQVKTQLSGRMIETDQEFLQHFHMIKKDSFYILAGNQDTKLERLFTTDEIEYLIDKARAAFDVVLIDAGSHFDNACMVQALNLSDMRFYVTNQQRKASKKFNIYYSDVLYPLGYNRTDFLMIINSFEDKTFLPSTKSINSEVDIPMITQIHKSPNGLMSEQEQSILYSYDDELYKASVQIISKSISAHLKIDLEFDNKKKKTIFGFTKKG